MLKCCCQRYAQPANRDVIGKHPGETWLDSYSRVPATNPTTSGCAMGSAPNSVLRMLPKPAADLALVIGGMQGNVDPVRGERVSHPFVCAARCCWSRQPTCQQER